MNKKIIFSTGGTGGHLFPAINMMKHFFQNGYEVILVTDERGNIFFKNNLELKSYVLKTSTLTNKSFFRKITSIFTILHSIISSIFILKKEKPDLIFGFGGYVSFPICFACKFFSLPLVIYENNMILGRANKFLSIFSKKILLANKISSNFPKKYINKICQVGPILNKKIINFSPVKKSNNNENFSILVLGGSQGTDIFGKIIPLVVKMLKEEGHKIEIYQHCIANQKKSIIEFYIKNNIKNYVFEFEEDVAKLISKSDLAITRCGASATAELVHMLTPFIAVPLPNSIDNHQYLNAKYYEKKGFCWLLKQDDFNEKNLFNLISDVLINEKKLRDISKNMEKNCIRDVYNKVEKEIKELI